MQPAESVWIEFTNQLAGVLRTLDPGYVLELHARKRSCSVRLESTASLTLGKMTTSETSPVMLHTAGSVERLAQLAVGTLRDVHGVEMPEELTYEAFDSDSDIIFFWPEFMIDDELWSASMGWGPEQ